MASKKALVITSGQVQQMPATDNLDLSDTYAELGEVAPAGNPAAAKAWVYARDNGLISPDNRTQLVVEWSDGSVTVIAESPAS